MDFILLNYAIFEDLKRTYFYSTVKGLQVTGQPCVPMKIRPILELDSLRNV